MHRKDIKLQMGNRDVSYGQSLSKDIGYNYIEKRVDSLYKCVTNSGVRGTSPLPVLNFSNFRRPSVGLLAGFKT